jgi:hypothetical protein
MKSTDERDSSVSPIDELDKLRTYRQAAELLGIGYHKIQRAARKSIIRTWSLGDSKRYVTLRDILERMSATN